MALLASLEPVSIAFGILAAGLGSVMAYPAFARLMNTTRMTIDGSVLRIAHGPLPWRTPPILYVRDIRQITVTTRKPGSVTIHTCEAELFHGHRVALTALEVDARIASTIEALIERHTGIVNTGRDATNTAAARREPRG